MARISNGEALPVEADTVAEKPTGRVVPSRRTVMVFRFSPSLKTSREEWTSTPTSMLRQLLGTSLKETGSASVVGSGSAFRSTSKWKFAPSTGS